MAMPLGAFLKTTEGQDVLRSGRRFCCGGLIFQGFRGAPIECGESQMTDEEMRRIRDIDGTMERQWKIREDRLRSRVTRKITEYDDRRAVLRRRRNEIRESIGEDKDAGIPTNPSDLAEIARIDEQMIRLTDLAVVESTKLAERKGQDEELPAAAPPPISVTCPECAKESPEGHDAPARWLKGHMMHHEAGRRRKTA